MSAAPVPPRFLISGYYGFENLGDEAILSALTHQLRARRPDAVITALSASPERTRARLGIESVGRTSLAAIARAAREPGTVFLSGGGSLLQDVTGPLSVPYYLGALLVARAAGSRTMFLGQGVGPLGRRLSRLLVGAVARRVDALTVRDQGSADLLAACGVPPERIELTADPVLALPPAPPEVGAAAIREAGLDPGKPLIAVSVRPWPSWYEKQLKAFSAVLAQAAEQHGAQLLLIPFHRPDDEPLVSELADSLARPESAHLAVATLSRPLSPEAMLSVLAHARLVVGMRLHAVIMAAAVGVPAVGLVYDPKVAAFCERAGYPTVPSIAALEHSDTFAATLAAALDPALGAALEARVAPLREAAWRNVDLALELALGTYA